MDNISSTQYGEFCEYTRQVGHHVYRGGQDLRLDNVLREQSIQSDRPTRYLHIFCDTLELPSNKLELPENLRWLRIFTRSFNIADAQSPNVATIDVKTLDTKEEATVTIYADKFPSAIKLGNGSQPPTIFSDVNHESLSTDDDPASHAKLLIGLNSMGFSFKLNSSKVVDRSAVIIHDVDPAALEFTMEDLMSSNSLQQPNYLGHLMEAVFCEGAKILSNIKSAATSRSMFRFVAKCTRKAPSFSELHMQARTIQQRLELPKDSVLWVPNVEVSDCKTKVQLWTDNAKTLHENQQTLAIITEVQKGNKEAKTAIKEVGAVIVKQLGYSHTNIFLEALEAQGKYDESRTLLDARQKDYQAFSQKVQHNQETFQRGVKEMMYKQKEQAAAEGFIAVFQIGVAIGTAIATCGASAPASTAAVVSAGAKIGGIAEDFADIIAKLKKIYALLQKFQEAAKKIWGIAQQFQSSLAEKTQQGSDANASLKALSEKVLPATAGNIDFVALHMDWEDFRLDMDETLKLITAKLPGMDGIDDYRVNMAKMILRAQAVIEAQKTLQNAMERKSRAEADEARLKTRQKEVQEIASRLQTEDKSVDEMLEIQRKVAAAELNSVKRWCFVYLHEYSLALMYSLAIAKFPLNFSATQDLDAFQNSAAVLYSQYKKPGSVIEYQDIVDDVPFSSTDSHGIFGPDWKSMLQTEGKVRFRIPYDHPNCSTYQYIRVTRARAFLEGAKWAKQVNGSSSRTTENLMTIRIWMGPRVELLVEGEHVEYYIQSPAPRFRARLDDRGTMSKIETDGRFSSTVTCISSSLFCSGEVQLENASDWNLSSVDAVRLEFSCSGGTSY